MEFDFGILIAQIINFAILFFVLSYFVYKPFLKLLEKRRNVIASGVKNAQEAEDRILEIEKMKEASLRSSEEERKNILIKAETEAKNRAGVIIAEAENDKVVILEKAKNDSDAFKEKAKEKIKEGIVNNAFDLAEKLLKENINKENNKQITAEFLSKMKI